MQQPIISIGTGNFFYWNLSLVQKLRYLQNIEDISGIEISCVPHGTKFSSEEISLLAKYSYNTLHLWKFDATDKEWMMYCKNIIPNFRHFVVHPDAANLDDIDSETEECLSFENMDPRKVAYQKPEEMEVLFNRFPKAKFTFDINHAEENNIPRIEFQSLKNPEQLHFSTVNHNFYPEFPEIDTSHALAHLNPNFDKNIIPWIGIDTIITLEGVFPVDNQSFILNELNYIKNNI
ncbi:hypothetical protein GW819_02190 [Candidatus Gracilibacteria bacterium]|nr:hypothetical protein [Candidatus Gracilibacteria bacterium]OIO76639.1 MAG: hypothetical protein AUJ87_02370 [Candidatus Gracilibacteria bacterium CG1_02_38_174]PIQ11318.1 MAG: hypothetical protein COW68_02970 [Candidatus Gracilibacteria bacterium CG18_big_fil_WC_8_21_14_2_50_38_16]PIQ41128.1 MAG: hypothetical protein COW06_03930 [Candidatus Gracilibacteria bacterium CG12_big_fil_rev_8_21_14_0_65_38_15]PIZ02045.1 MAG: hypothetical protein COY60_00385 [Candidatus Gracilibacteria bacterium CG_4